MTQFARPDADQAANSWVTAPLWSKVEEGSPGDATVITSNAVGNNVNTSNGDLRCDDVTDPASDSGHIIRAKMRHTESGRNMTGNVELWEGVPGSGTLRAALVQLLISDSTLTEYTHTLTSGEADSITDYTDLYIRLWGRGTGGGAVRSMLVDWCELEVPDAAASGRIMGAIAGTGGLAGEGGIAGKGGGLAG